jgi:hypothetical protein
MRTTHLLDGMHYRGLLRVVRRDAGIRVYAVHEPTAAPADRARAARSSSTRWPTSSSPKYAPLRLPSCMPSSAGCAYGAPQLARRHRGVRSRASRSGSRTRDRRRRLVLAAWRTGAVGETPATTVCACSRRSTRSPGIAGASSAFGLGVPVRGVHAAARRKLGYYALPLLWTDRVIGWANATVDAGRLRIEPRVRDRSPHPRSRAFRGELRRQIERIERS